MPTVLREGGFEIKINTDDHRPAHVHVWYQGALSIITLEPAVTEREVYGNLSRAQRRRAVRIVSENRDYLLKKWNEVHG
ncbi:MAG: DUF4160 domain-containing protein [Pyrinomonadaceae bacterium]